MTDTELKLLQCFPNSFINHNGEFIAHGKTNTYFILKSCKDGLEIKYKVLEWLSRSACKTSCYKHKKKNDEFHSFMLNGINKFLNTNFTEEDMVKIYTKLGNGVNRTLCEKFVHGNYDMRILEVEV